MHLKTKTAKSIFNFWDAELAIIDWIMLEELKVAFITMG